MTNNTITKLTDLNLVDRFLFDEVMEDKEAYQNLVSILLENEIHLLTRPETEKELRVSPLLRQVRLDVVGMDVNQRLYYTEMQKADTGNLRKRSRYYQAQLDVSLLEPGTANFNLLNDSCFILIAPFDIFGKGLYRYTFEGTCRECPELKIKDGALRVFINTTGTNRSDFSGEFLDLMKYITNSTDAMAKNSGSPRLQRIHESVRKIRASEKMGVKYMQKWEELVYAKEEGIAEGKAQGIAEGKTQGIVEGKVQGIIEGDRLRLIKMICRKLAKDRTPETIAKELEEDLSIVTEICKVAEEYAPDYDCGRIYEALNKTLAASNNSVMVSE